jgi:phosphomevalonate kinase
VYATAPGKLILTGEYAVLDGAQALVIAVNRRVIARHRTGPLGSSPFLVAVAAELARKLGDAHPAARAALAISVDSSALYLDERSEAMGGGDPTGFAGGAGGNAPRGVDADPRAPGNRIKLGLGSSAAVTVAATALALVPDEPIVPVIDRELVAQVAAAAHAAAQGPRGSRGSGADIAAAVHGGALAFSTKQLGRVTWPSGLVLLPFFTGASADTPSLVARVAAARQARPVEVNAALTSIAEVSRAACLACAGPPGLAATALISALQLAAVATDRLAAVTQIPLVPPCVTAARKALARLGGTAKTTGAGGGDVAIGMIPATEDVTVARRYLIESGCQPLDLAIDQTGVDLQPDAQ